MSIDQTASALNAALQAFGETLGRALAEGIALGVQEGLAQSLDLERLAEGAATRPASVAAPRAAAGAMPAPARRRGGRPRGEAKPCDVAGCPDPARSRGLCSRHYQQELRREKAEMSQAIHVAPPSAPISARPPIVRRRADEVEPTVIPPPSYEARPVPTPQPQQDHPRSSPIDAAKRIFG